MAQENPLSSAGGAQSKDDSREAILARINKRLATPKIEEDAHGNQIIWTGTEWVRVSKS